MIINILWAASQLYKSDYSVLNKWKLFSTYFILECKLLLYSYSEKKKQYFKLLDYKLATFNYEMLAGLFREIFISQDYKFETNNKTPFILDCGANMGLATIYFKWKYPQSNIIAFEPDKEIFELLKENIEFNKITGVTLVNAALLDRTGKVEFYSSVESSWNSGVGSISSKQEENRKKIEVNCVRLSDYVDQNVDFIKMDIEGSEDFVIKDLMISRKFNLIQEFIIEYHHKISSEKSKFGKFLDFFEQNDYEYQIRGNYSKKEQFQDILLYVYKNRVENSISSMN